MVSQFAVPGAHGDGGVPDDGEATSCAGNVGAYRESR